MSLLFVAYFTEYGEPKEGLSPTIRIRDLSDNSLVITDVAMSEVGDGFYKYTYTDSDNADNYAGRAYGGSGQPAGEKYVPCISEVAGTVQAIETSINNLGAASGGALNFAPSGDNTGGPIIDSVTFVGSVVSGTYEDLDSSLLSSHSIDDVGNDIDIVYKYEVGGGRIADAISLHADVDGPVDQISVKVYDHVGSIWDTLGVIENDTNLNLSLLAKHTGTGSELGNVYVRFDTDTTTPSNLEIFSCLVSAVNVGQTVGYAQGAIWLDTINGTAGSEPFVNGVADNPTDNWSDVLSLVSALGIKRIYIANGSTVTLTGNTDNFDLLGGGLFALNLNNQSLANAYVNHASLNGTSSGSGTIFEDCQINADVSTGPAFFIRCGFNTPTGTPYTSNGAGEYDFVDSVSLVPGSGTPCFDFSGQGTTVGINFRRWSGGSHIILDADCTASMEVLTGGGQTVITGGGNYEIRGIYRSFEAILSGAGMIQTVGTTGIITLSGTATTTVTLFGIASTVSDSSSGTTVNDYTINTDDITSILEDTETTIPGLIGALNNISSAEVNAQCDLAISDANLSSDLTLIKAVTDALTTAAAAKLALSAGTMVAGTVSHDNTAATTTVFYVSDITEATPDHFNGRIVIFTSGALQYQATDILDYELESGEGKFTVTALTEAPADNVTFIIV